MSFLDDVLDAVVTVISNAIGTDKDAFVNLTDAIAQLGYSVSDFIDQMRFPHRRLNGRVDPGSPNGLAAQRHARRVC